jgi:hypothetical protein
MPQHTKATGDLAQATDDDERPMPGQPCRHDVHVVRDEQEMERAGGDEEQRGQPTGWGFISWVAAVSESSSHWEQIVSTTDISKRATSFRYWTVAESGKLGMSNSNPKWAASLNFNFLCPIVVGWFLMTK